MRREMVWRERYGAVSALRGCITRCAAAMRVAKLAPRTALKRRSMGPPNALHPGCSVRHYYAMRCFTRIVTLTFLSWRTKWPSDLNERCNYVPGSQISRYDEFYSDRDADWTCEIDVFFSWERILFCLWGNISRDPYRQLFGYSETDLHSSFSHFLNARDIPSPRYSSQRYKRRSCDS